MPRKRHIDLPSDSLFSEEENLLECPFCGGTAKVIPLPATERNHLTFMAAECLACGARGPVSASGNREKAAKKWNDQTSWKLVHSTRYILEDSNPEALAEACGLPLGVITNALENILPKTDRNAPDGAYHPNSKLKSEP